MPSCLSPLPAVCPSPQYYVGEGMLDEAEEIGWDGVSPFEPGLHGFMSIPTES